MVYRDVIVTNCYVTICDFDISVDHPQIVTLAYYKRDFLKKKHGGVTTVWSHMFSVIFRFQILGKKVMQKNLILCFFEMSVFETE